MWSNACHAVTVEVDTKTGQVEILRYVVAEDCGRMINPNIVDGQVHGGVAQGIGGVLYEHNVYDPDGNPLASTFLDYLLPTAAEIPVIETVHMETPAATTGGYKGVGEGGAIGAPPAVFNAVADALAQLGATVTRPAPRPGDGARRDRSGRPLVSRQSAGAPRRGGDLRDRHRRLLRPVRLHDRRRSVPGLAPAPRRSARSTGTSKHGFYALSRYDDVHAGLLDMDTFVSGHGIVLEMITDEPFGTPDDDHDGSAGAHGAAQAGEPARSRRGASPTSRCASPRSAPSTWIRSSGTDGFDYIEAFAGLLPAHRDPRVARIPRRPRGRVPQHRRLRRCTSSDGATPITAAARRPSVPRSGVGAAVSSSAGVFDLLPELIANSDADPQDDLHHRPRATPRSRTTTASPARSPTKRSSAFVQLLSLAGGETVVRAARLRRRHPRPLPRPAAAAARRPRADPQRGRGAAALRSAVADPVAVGRPRHRAARPRRQAGLEDGAAQRQRPTATSATSPIPTAFDVRREIDRHLAFGYGTHFCIGAALARLEGKVGIAETLAALPHVGRRRSRARARAHQHRARLHARAGPLG